MYTHSESMFNSIGAVWRRGRLALCAVLVSCLVLSTLSAAQSLNLPSSFIAVTTRPVTYVPSLVNAIEVVEGQETVAGIAAAFYEVNSAGGYMGRNFTIVNFDTAPATDYAVPVAQAISYPGALAILNPGYETSPVCQALTAGTGFPIVGGLSSQGTNEATGEQRRLINIRTDFGADSFLLIKYAINSELFCNHFGIVYYDDPTVLELAKNFAAQLESLYFDRPNYIPNRVGINRAQFYANFTAAFKINEPLARPQCFVLLASTSDVLSLFVGLNASGFNPAEYSWLAPSVVSSADWSGLPGFDAGWYNSFHMAHQFPNPLDTRYTITAKYKTAMQRLFSTGYKQASLRDVVGVSGGSWRPSLQSMEGYLTGRLFIEMVRATNPTAFSRTALVDTVYSKRLFTLDDIVLGPYADGCVGEQKVEAIYPCSCNAGTKKLFLSSVSSDGATKPVLDDVSSSQVGISEQVLPSQVCGSTEMTTYVPLRPLSLHVSIVSFDASAILKKLAERFTTVMYYAFIQVKASGLGNANTNAAIVAFSTPAGFDLSYDTLVTLLPSRLHMQGATGMALQDNDVLKNVTQFPIIAPLRYHFAEADDFIKPFGQWNAGYIPIFPTLTDFMFTAVSWATSVSNTCLTVSVVADTSFMVGQALRACNTYQYKELAGAWNMFDSYADSESTIVPGTARYNRAMNSWTAARGATPSNGFLIVATHSAEVLQAAMMDTTRSDIRIVIVTSEFVLYDVLNATLNATYMPATNVHFASGYRMNYVSSSSTETVVDPVTAYAGIVAGLVYLTAGQISGANTGVNFLSTMYVARTWGPTFASVILGPFYNTSCGLKKEAEHPGGQCQCSKGLSSFYIRQLSEYAKLVVNASYKPSSSQLTFTMNYPNCAVPWRPLAVPVDLTTALASAGAAIAIVIIGSIVAICLIRRALQRDNSAAPKDPNKPFAIAFTDIQSSTTMWARAPARMGPAVDLHHEVLREAVKAYRGYEVKTIGDSFMVAFEKPEDAVKFAVGIQSRLYEAPWNTAVFDETYKELIAEAAQKALVADADGVMSPTLESTGNSGLPVGGKPTFESRVDPLSPRPPPSALKENQQTGIQPPEQYDANWCGLRVRVGVHYGTGSIKLDPISQGYDYYGTVVNTAARVEGVSHGGQVCITQAVFDAISGSSVLKDMTVTNLGPQPLRGLDEGVVLHQVLPNFYAQRVFPPLRLDVEKEVDEGDASSDSAQDTVTASNISGTARAAPSVDELIGVLNKHIKGSAKERVNRSVKYGYIFLENLLATVRPKVQQELLDKMAEAWRVKHLSKRAGMRRFRKGLMPPHAFTMTLVAYRVSAAADRSQSQSEASDAETGTSGSRKDSRLQFSTPRKIVRAKEATSPALNNNSIGNNTAGGSPAGGGGGEMVLETPLAGINPATEWENAPGAVETAN